MKNLCKPIVLIAIIAIAMTSSRKLRAQPQNFVSFQVFYNELNPYGSWIEYPEYGYVWSPNVSHDFRPYGTNGYWVATEYGNTWVSDYSWGWAPFHYGRWLFDNYYGWLWVPGNEWAPAWVAWRSGGGYYGWAPLSPNVNISVSFNHFIPNNYWVFVPQRHICGPGLSNYYVRHSHTVNIINHTTIINNVHHNNRYYTGPSFREVESVRGRPVRVYAVNNSNRPGRTVVDNRSVNIYRPQVQYGTSRERDRPEHFTKHEGRGNYGRRTNNDHDHVEKDYNKRQNFDTQRNYRQQDQRRERQGRDTQNAQHMKTNDEPVQRDGHERSRERVAADLRNNSQRQSSQLADRRVNQIQDQRTDRKQTELQNQRSHIDRLDSREHPVSNNNHQRNLNSNQRQQIEQPRISDSRGNSKSEHQRKR